MGKGLGKTDVSWCHLKLHTKLERRGKPNIPNLESVACEGQGSKTPWPSKFPTLFSTEIVPLTCIPLSGNLQNLSSCPLYIALGEAHRCKQKIHWLLHHTMCDIFKWNVSIKSKIILIAHWLVCFNSSWTIHVKTIPSFLIHRNCSWESVLGSLQSWVCE